MGDMPVVVRGRVDDDLDACERLARVVHDLDGYPSYLFGSLRDFLTSEEAFGAWVAEVSSEIVGHVALHQRALPAVMELGRATTGLSDDGLAVVARLLVSPAIRRRGVGRALLATAISEAAGRGLRPILDVVTIYDAAIALYDASGWVRVGTARGELPDGSVIDEFVYVLGD